MATETAYAKLNLALHVRRRREDGYHELETVFAFCEHGDEVSTRTDGEGLSISGPFAQGLSTTDNLVTRAAKLAGLATPLHLVKNLPVASGVGGGSADAAAVIRLSQRLTGHAPGPGEALALGADVPACIASVTVRASGVGEVFSPEPAVTGMPVLLVNPRIPLSTGAVFAAWDGLDRGPLNHWRDGRNDLEDAARNLVPEVGLLLDWLMRRRDVTISRMSGSGATCFALFENVAARQDAAAACACDWPDAWLLETALR